MTEKESKEFGDLRDEKNAINTVLSIAIKQCGEDLFKNEKKDRKLWKKITKKYAIDSSKSWSADWLKNTITEKLETD
jgi:hypothetical protein